MRYGILGPVEVWDGERRLAVGGPQQRALLAVLLVDANRVVSAERLVTQLWGDHPPATARALLQGCVAGLRRALRANQSGQQPLLTRAPGYLLEVAPDELDADRFDALVAEARSDRITAAQAAVLLSEALALWRGPALAGVEAAVCRAAAIGLEDRRLAVLADRIDLDLRLGRHHAVIPELQALVQDYPLRERLWGQLMLALHRADRRGEALTAYRRLRQSLVDELGIEPGEPLRQLHRAILAEEPEPASDPGRAEAALSEAPSAEALAERPAAGALAERPLAQALPEAPSPEVPSPEVAPLPDGSPPGAPIVPAQLPMSLASVTGRVDQLKQLDELLAEPSGGLPIGVIHGPAGVGKTTVAVHWAHRAREWFPDGQLYVDLHGFDPDGPAIAPAEAVRGFLDALGVPPERIPSSLPARTGLYRSRLADRRMLVVLDNAYGTEQVRPLLPGTPGCLVLVTSRNQLPGLVAVEGARPVALDVLSQGDARELLAHRLGAHRVGREPAAVEQLLDLCAGLPLALAVVAARAAVRPDFPLAEIARELEEAGAGLDRFTSDNDRATDLRAVFSWSYRALDRAPAQLFRQLGLHPGPELGTAAAASLAGWPVAEARKVLARLVLSSLLTEPVAGRYRLHDLLRDYAAEQAAAVDGERERHEALRRVVDHYLRTAHAADRRLYGFRETVSLKPPPPGVAVAAFTDDRAAEAWFSAELPVLLNAIEQAAARDWNEQAWQLAWAVAGFLDQRAYWQELATTQRIALSAARRIRDRTAEAWTWRILGRASMYTGQRVEAESHLNRALRLFTELDDRAGQARTHHVMATMLDRFDRTAEAIPHVARALALHRARGDEPGQAGALNTLGWCYTRIGEHRRALDCCVEAVSRFQRCGNRLGEADTWDSLGHIYHHLGDIDEAIACYHRAVDLFQQLGERFYLAETLGRLGDAYEASESADPARDAWRQAVTILDQLGHPDAEALRARLSD